MKQNSEQKVEITNVSPACGKPLVVGSTVYLMDCVEGMKHYPDKYFDLAVVDPPYGINMGEQMATGWASKSGGTKFASKEWDLSIPEMEYFIELFRVSKEQIVWGGNYMTSFLPHSSCWLVWDKHNGDSLFADAELAWTSFKKPVRLKKIHWCGSAAKHETGKNKIHPTQKPIKLYDWVFTEFVKKGARVLDTHIGSQSSRIAADKAGLDFTGFEIDKEYYDLGEKRFKEYKSQLRIEWL